MPSTLIAGKGASYVTRGQLSGIATPPWSHSHRPIAHAELVDLMQIALERAGYALVGEQYAVQREGLRLFGTWDIENHGASAGPGTSLALGFRHANDKQMALAAVSGARVIVCSNLALAGDQKLFRIVHRHGVVAHLREGLDRFFGDYGKQIASVAQRFDQWREAPLDDVHAKALVYDAVTTDVIPGRLLPTVHVNYFRATERQYEDCAPRTKMGLHNAFTRAFKPLAPAVSYRAQLGLTRLLA